MNTKHLNTKRASHCRMRTDVTYSVAAANGINVPSSTALTKYVNAFFIPILSPLCACVVVTVYTEVHQVLQSFRNFSAKMKTPAIARDFHCRVPLNTSERSFAKPPSGREMAEETTPTRSEGARRAVAAPLFSAKSLPDRVTIAQFPIYKQNRHPKKRCRFCLSYCVTSVSINRSERPNR